MTSCPRRIGQFRPRRLIREGQGSRVWDEDGKEYVDYLIGSGPMLLGHGHPEVSEAVAEQIAQGHDLFRQQQRRGRAGGGNLPRGPVCRAGAFSVLGWRGGHVCDTAGARVHRARQDRQVRRRLPRHVGRGADEPGPGAAAGLSAGAARQRRHSRGGTRADADRAVQRPGPPARPCCRAMAARWPD